MTTTSTRPALGAMLITEGIITEGQLEAALAAQRERGRPLGQILVAHGALNETDLASALARQMNLSFIDLADYTIDPSAVALVPEAMIRRAGALPIGWNGQRLLVAMAEPSNVVAIDDIQMLTGADLEVVVAARSQLHEAIERLQRFDNEADEVAQLAATEAEEDEPVPVAQVVEDAPIVKFVNLLISQAVADRASDIHVEPTETDLRIRFRVDGVLHEVMRSPRSIQNGVISRLKVIADINIAERRIPQDGRTSFQVGARQVDVRVATLPTLWGEKIVMRLLDKGQARLQLSDLGFLPASLSRYEACFRKPYGTILTTGPTGSRLRRRLAANESGFTLIELMVVVMIIALLVAIAVPTFFGARTKSQDASAKSTLQISLSNAQVVYTETQAYPATADLATALNAEEPNLAFASTASTGPKVVSVQTSASVSGGVIDTVILAAVSDSGECFWVRHIADPGATGAGTSKAQKVPASTESCVASQTGLTWSAA